MSINSSNIITCLWFDGQATEAAQFYTSIFPNSSIGHTHHYPKYGTEHHGHTAGSVCTVAFNLNGHSFVGLNGGPHFKFSPATSFQIMCDDQKEVDHYWEKLTTGGNAQMIECGWLEDKFGISWQVVPKCLVEYLEKGDQEQKERVTEAFMGMKKLEIEGIKKAYAGA